MFTGIIEEIGTIQMIRHSSHSVTLKIKAKKVLEETKIGDSIATNGVCLTVIHMDSNSFTADVMYETLQRTNIKHLSQGAEVNLERALRLSDRLGGHLVSGHIDGIGVIRQIRQQDIAKEITITVDSKLMRYIIPKGSVAIDGISLTVVDTTSLDFIVSIIPHTQKDTTLSNKKIGDVVNIECDMIGKYVERLLGTDEKKNGITEDFLKKYGF